jgi:hypothetical protein
MPPRIFLYLGRCHWSLDYMVWITTQRTQGIRRSVAANHHASNTGGSICFSVCSTTLYQLHNEEGLQERLKVDEKRIMTTAENGLAVRWNEQHGVAVALYTCVRGIPGSNRCQINGYPHWGASSFPQSLQANAGTVLVMAASFKILTYRS